MSGPRKRPPVEVPNGSKYCWSCQSVLPRVFFATDRNQRDGKRMDCRACDSRAASARAAQRRARLKAQVACAAHCPPPMLSSAA